MYGVGVRGLIAIAAGIAAVSVLAIVVLAVAGEGGPSEFPADSPEAALQAYLTAFENGDYPAAYAYFSNAAQATVSLEQFEQAATDYGTYPEASRRVTYDGTDGSGDEVTLQVTVETSSPGGLSSNRYTYSSVVPMVREAGDWRIAEAIVFLEPGWFGEPAPAAK